MQTEQEQQTKIAQGRDAQSLKTNPALEECMNTTLGRLFMEWCATGPSDGDQRMAIWSTMRALEEFKATIDVFIDTGKLEEANKNADEEADSIDK